MRIFSADNLSSKPRTFFAGGETPLHYPIVPRMGPSIDLTEQRRLRRQQYALHTMSSVDFLPFTHAPRNDQASLHKVVPQTPFTTALLTSLRAGPNNQSLDGYSASWHLLLIF